MAHFSSLTLRAGRQPEGKSHYADAFSPFADVPLSKAGSALKCQTKGSEHSLMLRATNLHSYTGVGKKCVSVLTNLVLHTESKSIAEVLFILHHLGTEGPNQNADLGHQLQIL